VRVILAASALRSGGWRVGGCRSLRWRTGWRGAGGRGWREGLRSESRHGGGWPRHCEYKNRVAVRASERACVRARAWGVRVGTGRPGPGPRQRRFMRAMASCWAWSAASLSTSAGVRRTS
jgi:hypothetical protein